MPGLIVHEWIEPSGGAEKVLDEMVGAFPDADIFCLWNDAPQRYKDRIVRESWLAKTFLRRRKALALPFMPITWRNLRSENDYEWTLASSHLFAHHARVIGAPQDIPTYVYTHTPARYLWTPDLDARGAGLIPKVASSILKPIDRRAARSNTSLAANSQFVRQRMSKTWGVESQVIYPPVDVTKVQAVASWSDGVSGPELEVLENLPKEFLLGASRFVPYKRLDLVIDMGAVAGLPVVLAGSGPEEMRLRDQASNAGIPVIFVLRPSDELLYALYQRALAFIFPAIEDFGIMPVEAMAAGSPVIVNSEGGASESVIDGVTGCHLNSFDRESVVRALAQSTSLDRNLIKKRATDFSKERFIDELRGWVCP